MKVSPEEGALNGLFVERNCRPSLRINLSSNSEHTPKSHVSPPATTPAIVFRGGLRNLAVWPGL